jgi:hypothetical protein
LGRVPRRRTCISIKMPHYFPRPSNIIIIIIIRFQLSTINDASSSAVRQRFIATT